MNSENTVFFSSCNDYYVVYAITSLLSVRKFIPDAKLFVIGHNFSTKSIRLFNKFNIEYLELDLSDKFTTHWDPYPVECYYYFAGPELFAQMGYDYSVYLDGDVFCNQNPLLNKFTVSMAGAGVKSGEKFFGKQDWSVINKLWKIRKKDEYVRIQSGVTYFNNQELAKSNFLETVSFLFKKCLENNIPRKGDDSLTALYQEIFLQEDEKAILDEAFILLPNVNKQIPDNEKIRFIHFTLEKPWKKHPYKHIKGNQTDLNPYIKKWRRIFFKVSKERWIRSYINLEHIKALYVYFQKIKKGIKREFQASFGLRYHIWRRRKNIKKRPIKTYWYKNVTNFGDLITGDILKELFGYNIEWAPPEKCELICAGSILDDNTKESAYVWGSGIIKDGPKIKKKLNYRAVRGKLTLGRINVKGKQKVALGDPGLLVNLVYPVSGVKTGKIGVIPHYVDTEHPIIKKIKQDERFTIISVADPPQKNAETISQCKLILSSSLHGLIFADSFGVPNAHIQLSDKVVGGEYKFKDYCSAINKNYNKANLDKIMEEEYLNKIIRDYRPIDQLKTIQKELIKSFPFK